MTYRPNIIAEISQDLASTSGQILTADVHAITGSKKRKRSELAVAVDHQGITIYNVLSHAFHPCRAKTNIR